MKKRIIVNLIIAILILIMVLCLLGSFIKKSDEECLGYYVGDLTIEPIIFADEIYFPNPAYPYDENRDFDLDMKLCGNIKNQYLYVNKGKLKFPLYYIGYFMVDQVWVNRKYEQYEHLEVTGGYSNEYSKVTYLENPERIRQILEENGSYILISKNNTSKKQCIISKDMVMELENDFGECTYEVKDFDEMKEAYYVTTNPYYEIGSTNEELWRELAKDLPRRGHYIGTIFVDKNGNLYYCNRNNLIDYDMTQRIYSVLETGNMLQQ